MGTGARVFTAADTGKVQAFCELDPVVNLTLLARLSLQPIGTRGIQLYGYEDNGRLSSLCLVAGNIIISGSNDGLADYAYRYIAGRVSSLVGPAHIALELHRYLVRRGGLWAYPRNIRHSQPLMVWKYDSQVAPDPEVRKLTEAEYPSYLEASVRMYTEEIGQNPLSYGLGYEDHVRQRLKGGAAYGVVRNGRVLFKADLGVSYRDHVQIQGVWLDPLFRGRGLAAPAMTAVL
ncbi:MAG: hypothetical protein CR979_01095, partial [Propionibacterium sp.]